MPTTDTPCPRCGKAGAQLLRCHSHSSDYLCEMCLTEFFEPAVAVPPASTHRPDVTTTIH
jgi:hypothetical protein